MLSLNIFLLNGCLFESLFFPQGTYEDFIDANDDDYIMIHAYPNMSGNVMIHAWNDNNLNINQQMYATESGWYQTEIYESEFNFKVDIDGSHSSDVYLVDAETWIVRVPSGIFTSATTLAPTSSMYNILFHKPDDWSGAPLINYNGYTYNMYQVNSEWYGFYIGSYYGDVYFYDNNGNSAGPYTSSGGSYWIIPQEYWSVYSYNPFDSSTGGVAGYTTNSVSIAYGDFEESSSELSAVWTYSTGGYTSQAVSYCYNNSYSYGLTVYTGSDFSIYRNNYYYFSMLPGRDYIFNCYVYSSIANISMQMIVDVYDTAGAVIGTFESFEYYNTGTTMWTNLHCYIEDLGSSVSNANITIKTHNYSAADETVYVDYIHAYELIPR